MKRRSVCRLRLSQVAANHANQFLANLRRIRAPMTMTIDDVIPNVIFQHLGEETVDGPSTRRDALQDLVALHFFSQRPLDGFDLTSNAPHAVNQLFFLANDV